MADSRSVGVGGDNVTEDVEVVQTMLSDFLVSTGLPELEVTGVVDVATIAAINAFEVAQAIVPTGLLHVPEEEPIALLQGQGEGDTIKEACMAAREVLKANANCGADAPLRMGKCTCWKGGSLTWTCIVTGGCQTPIA
jgi:hypothetical protein